MTNAFVDKLRGYGELSESDAQALAAVCRNRRDVPARHDLISEGDPPGPIFVILSGWGCRYKLLPDGTRQILAFLLPGDSCDIHVDVLDEMDHSIATLTNVHIATIARSEMDALVGDRPAIRRVVWTKQLVDESVLRAWICSMGRRNSTQRVAHLMCEIYIRMRNIGLAADDRCEMPLQQIMLADALGLTPVHVNRVLRKLRLAGIMEIGSGKLVIKNPAQLAAIAGFDENYLHRRLKLAA